jgi:transposase-like protein
MEFPIADLLDYESSVAWIRRHFHPTGLKCPECGAPRNRARIFRETRRSQLVVYRCNQCDTVYNLYSGTIFQQTHLTPMQVVLLMRGICKGESSKVLAAELKLNYFTVLRLRHAAQVNAEKAQPDTPLLDQHTETDEMFQNAGEKRGRTL